VLVERPYKGWKFVGWHGACKSTKRKCVLSDTRRNVQVGAKFIAVGAGLTRAHPLPIGTSALVGDGLVVKVTSANANVQLSPAAAAGDEYYDAYVTVTNTGNGQGESIDYDYAAVGSHHATYQADSCPSQGPRPALDLSSGLSPGQSTSGYICWQIAASDASTLEFFTGDGTLDGTVGYPGTRWFALH
jgi:hypothetical protein